MDDQVSLKDSNLELGNTDAKMLEGGRKKNGHKINCSCQICNNMRNKAKRKGYTADKLKKMEGASKKPNGHRADCMCPICKNMMKKYRKKGGANEDVEENVDIDEDANMDMDMDTSTDMEGGKRRHRSRRSRTHRRRWRSSHRRRRTHRGGENPVAFDELDLMEKGDMENSEDLDTDPLDKAEQGEAGLNVVGGRRHRRARSQRRKKYSLSRRARSQTRRRRNKRRY